MKVVSVVLSIYFLALNFVPCNDGELLADDSQIVNTLEFGDSHDHGGFDLCSPFCNCHCCHVHTLDFGIVSFEPIRPTISEEVFAYFNSPGKEIPFSLFLPPRV